MADIAVAGMAVMGRNLALNIESRGYTVAVHNRTARTLETFVDGVGAGKRLVPCRTLPDVVAALNRPRRILLMVQAGAPVDAVLGELQPLLEPGDVILDGGNSHFADTTRRCRDAEASDLLYLGTGVSGGDEGALHGPSIMPGGSEAAYRQVSPILTSIAAKGGRRTPAARTSAPAAQATTSRWCTTASSMATCNSSPRRTRCCSSSAA